jgi:uncharacterized membrane protein YciS (DUF1049 family)
MNPLPTAILYVLGLALTFIVTAAFFLKFPS